jgi:hypothetical protein
MVNARLAVLSIPAAIAMVGASCSQSVETHDAGSEAAVCGAPGQTCPSCASVAAEICQILAACPLREGFTQLCFTGSFPGSTCFGTLAGCEAIWVRLHGDA